MGEVIKEWYAEGTAPQSIFLSSLILYNVRDKHFDKILTQLQQVAWVAQLVRAEPGLKSQLPHL